jgi:hypothetical protein
MVVLWFSYGFYFGFPMVFLWFSYGFPMVFLWFSYGFSFGFPMVFYCFPMVFLWFSYGFPVVFLWFSYHLCRPREARVAREAPPSETHRSCDHRKHIQIRIHVYMLITSTTSTTSTPSTTSTTNDELADHMKRHNSYISNLIDTHGRRWPDRWVMQVKSWIDHIHRHPHQTISFNRILIKAASIFIFG